MNIFPTISSDGRLVVFASNRSKDRHLHIWVQPFGPGSQPVQLTFGQADDITPDVSPDGTAIVFRSNREPPGIYRVPVPGGEAQCLAQGGWRPRYSKTGDQIVFQAAMNGGPSELHVMPARGGQARPLGIAQKVRLGGLPIWTPDGSHILFAGTGESGDFDWWSVPSAGGDPRPTGLSRQLRAQGLGDLNADTTPGDWIHNSLVFSLPREGVGNIWMVPMSAGSWTVRDRVRQVTSGTGLEMSPRTSSKGRAVFSSDVRNTRLWGLELSTSANEEKELAHDFSMGPGHYRNPSTFTAAGQLLAFTSWRTGGSEIWLRDRGTGKDWVLANEPGHVADPILSRSGKTIAYRVQEEGIWAIYAGDPQRGGIRKRICRSCGTPSAWLPGDQQILVNENEALVVLDSANGTRTEWLRIPDVVSYFPAVSPTGATLALVTRSPRSGKSMLYAVRLAGGKPVDPGQWVTLPGNLAPQGAPVWSETGDRIYFFDESDGRRCLWSCQWDGKRLHNLKSLRHFHSHARYPWNSWLARSGDLLVFTLTESTSNIWALELFGSVP